MKRQVRAGLILAVTVTPRGRTVAYPAAIDGLIGEWQRTMHLHPIASQ